jgi:GDP-L-fucose synthase
MNTNVAMDVDSRIYIAGHNGLVGSAIVRMLFNKGYRNIITADRGILDLTVSYDVESFFKKEKIDFVFLAAAKVGGISANNRYPVDFLITNLEIQNNVIAASATHKIKRLLFMGSSCIYPKLCPQPIKEEYFLTGSLEPTNRPYALAKISGIELCRAFNRQHGTKFMAVMPTNLYGKNDRYHLEDSHVIPALIHKIHRCTINNVPEVHIWGTGKPLREFLFAEDAAEASIQLMNLPDDQYLSIINYEHGPFINLGSGIEISISNLAQLISRIIGYKGNIIQDVDRLDGTPRKLLDSTRLNSFLSLRQKSLEEGLAIAYQDYLQSSYAEQ